MKYDLWKKYNFKYSAVPSEYYSMYEEDLTNLDEKLWLQMISENLKFRITPSILSHCKSHTLIIRGNNELSSIKQSADIIKQTLPNSNLATVRQSQNWNTSHQHSWILKIPEVFIEVLYQWIQHNQLSEHLQKLE